MLGTIVNTLAIIGGSLLGLLLKGGVTRKTNATVMQAISLAVILIGLKSAFKSDALLLIIVSLAIGSIAGELLKIEDRLAALGQWFERRMHRMGNGISKGFVTASLVFCVGSMAIVGAMESGLTGNHQTLFAKSLIDGITSIVFASTLGIGVLLSALSVGIYQGLITVAATWVKPFLTAEVITQMTSVGGLLITAIGLNLLEIRQLKVGNMLPAIFVPLVWMGVKQMAAHF